MFKRTDINKAAKAAKTILESVAKKFNVGYEELVRALLGNI